MLRCMEEDARVRGGRSVRGDNGDHSPPTPARGCLLSGFGSLRFAPIAQIDISSRLIGTSALAGSAAHYRRLGGYISAGVYWAREPPGKAGMDARRTRGVRRRTLRQDLGGFGGTLTAEGEKWAKSQHAPPAPLDWGQIERRDSVTVTLINGRLRTSGQLGDCSDGCPRGAQEAALADARAAAVSAQGWTQ